MQVPRYSCDKHENNLECVEKDALFNGINIVEKYFHIRSLISFLSLAPPGASGFHRSTINVAIKTR